VTGELLRNSFRALYAELLRETAQPSTSGIIRPPKLRRNVDAVVGERTIQAILDAEYPFQQGTSCDTYTNMASLKRKVIQQNDSGKGGPFKGRSHQKVSLDVGPVLVKPPVPPPPPGPPLPGKISDATGILASTLQAKMSSLKPLAPSSVQLLSESDSSVKAMSDSLTRIQAIVGSAMIERRRAVAPPGGSNSSGSNTPVHWSEESDGEQQQQRLV